MKHIATAAILALALTGCFSAFLAGLTGVGGQYSSPSTPARMGGQIAREAVKGLPFGEIALTLLGLGTAATGAAVVRPTGRRNRRWNRKRGRRA